MFSTPTQRLTYDGYVSHGLGDLMERFIVRARGQRWIVASYFFPDHAGSRPTACRPSSTRSIPEQTLTGLPLVNRELGERFLPQFMKGLAIGTFMVVRADRWRRFATGDLSIFALLPTAVGLVWTAGILALAGVELDLFAMFAVVTFLGIGVDYGIHLVHRYREHGDAVRATAELAPVIFVAGAITLLGYGTLINSSYPPLRSIGVVSAVSVVALAAASVLVLPALLRLGTAGMTVRAAAIIPAFNEAASIGAVVEGIRATVAQVIVVDDGSTDRDRRTGRARLAPWCCGTRPTPGRATPSAPALRTCCRRAASPTCCCSTATCSIFRTRRRNSWPTAGETGADVVLGERRFFRTSMPASRYHANRLGSRVLSWFVGVPLQRYPVRIPGLSRRRAAGAAADAHRATRSRPRCW